MKLASNQYRVTILVFNNSVSQYLLRRARNFCSASTMFYKQTFFVIIACWLLVTGAIAQEQKVADSLLRIYEQDTAKGTARLGLLLNLSFNEIGSYKQAIKYAEELISLSQQAGNDKYLSAGYSLKGTKERLLGNLDEALAAFFKSAEISKRSHNLTGEGNAYGELGNTYSAAKNHATAMHYYNKAIATLRQSNDSISLASALSNTGDEFVEIKRYDSALPYFNESKIIFDKVNYLSGKVYSLGNIGTVYANIGKNALAEKNINEAIHILEQAQDYYPICDYLLSMTDVYAKKGDRQTALNYAIRSLTLAERYGLKKQIADANLRLSEIYESSGNTIQSFKHYKNYIAYRDSINDIKSVQKMYDLRSDFEESQHQVQLKLLNQQKRNQRNLVTSLIVILGLTVIILGILIKNNRTKQKAYTILDIQKQETDTQKAKAEDALNELQVTQSQLIHRERMASLGELTAGIAHEIQNPLNFVNNFSDVNAELMMELQAELTNGNTNEALAISKDIVENEKKINHHGKRADSIVKGMMQHARTSGGQKELTDINTLANEYVNLSYHAIRAKDKTFNVTMVTLFDESIQKINIIPQDIGRLLLNIYNNAFYSVSEKSRLAKEGYEPTVSVATKNLNKNVEIRIKDNGMGIPQKMVNKIFEPFFTTKPAGQGTGLGLSLSYDIIKAHGGTIEIETKEGEFAEFIIQLPISV